MSDEDKEQYVEHFDLSSFDPGPAWFVSGLADVIMYTSSVVHSALTGGSTARFDVRFTNQPATNTSIASVTINGTACGFGSGFGSGLLPGHYQY